MKHDKLQIVRRILLVCKDGAKKTENIYKANLNFKNAEIYLRGLIDREMIVEEEKYFKITPYGVELLFNLQNTLMFLDLDD
jgi:predicted transcriptional regulator